jgi:adenylate cyclase
MTIEANAPTSEEHLDDATLRQAAQSLSVGFAIVDQTDWSVLFENARFFKWFPPGAEIDGPVNARLPGFNANRASSRAESGRPYSFETESTSGGRTTPISVEVRRLSDQPDCKLIVECNDITKQKQSEYMLESYAKMAEKNARDLTREKDRVERLLLNIMPKSVYEEMKDYGTVTPQVFENATILMLDFVGSTEMTISKDAGSLITELNDMFTVFDRICELFGCERIRTIGDAYMAVSGLPEPTPEHAHNIARVAIRMLRYIEKRNAAHPEEWICRIGLHSGPVIGSIVGVQKYVYDIFGPGVNMASRMEGLSEPMQITVSDDTYQLLKNDFMFTERGPHEIKGFGEHDIYFLVREMPNGR